MIWNDLLKFKKQFSKKPPFVSLIVAKEVDERRRAALELLSSWKKGGQNAVCIEYEEFTKSRFIQEVETIPFLASSILVAVHDIDMLDHKLFESVLEHPNSWVSVIFTASNLPKNSKLYKLAAQKGEVLRLGEDKPWEKKKKRVHWLIDQAVASKVALPVTIAEIMVEHLSSDPSILSHELEKLICFITPNTTITAADVSAICCKTPHVTLWRLGEALFASDAAFCVQIAHALLDEGMAFFPLVAHLRTQLRSALLILSYYKEGGAPLVTKTFPYLKGGLLERKLRLYQEYGERRLKLSLIALFETELRAKSSQTSPTLLLELFFIRSTLVPPNHRTKPLSQ